MSDKKQFSELAGLVDFLRSKGVVHYKTVDVELTLLPDAPHVPEKEKKERDDQPKKRPGADGKTAKEQRELYGCVMDAEE